jgi:WD40 repeat protein
VGHSDSVRSIAPSRDLQLALSGGNDTVLRLWDLATGRTKKVLIGHEQSIRDVIWCLDQRFVLSGASDKEIRVWNVDSGRCVAKLVGHQYDIRQICETADSHLISGDSQGIIHFWSLRDIFATQVVG